jgi:hypothetical protein
MDTPIGVSCVVQAIDRSKDDHTIVWRLLDHYSTDPGAADWAGAADGGAC